MLTRDIIHRLRLRANEAQDAGRTNEAADLRLALDALIRLDRDAQLLRAPQRQQVSA